MRVVYVGNSTNHYFLYCSMKAAGCMEPEENKNYLLFNSNTRWKMPGAKDFITLAFVQDWTVKYNQGENIGLVPQDASGDMGMFILDPKGGGYETNVVYSDGPIAYGTDMNDADRHKAWEHFFMQKWSQQSYNSRGKMLLDRSLAQNVRPVRTSVRFH